MLAIVLHHFGVPGLGGGFVGIDVFFVISGFVIGGQLWAERRDTGRVAIGAFWLRRLRRLAPAFLVMLAASTIAAWVILLPFDLLEYGKSLVAATLLLANVQFWREASFLDTTAEGVALLHTWPLAVAAQFYVALPLLMAAFGALKRGLVGSLVLLWVASLLACLAITPTDPAAACYLTLFRLWELLTGVLLALWMQAAPRRVPDAVPLGGLCIILGSIIFVRPSGFPGWQAMLPVLGAAMVLAGQQQRGLAVRLLSLPAPVAVGLVSYSLYLWHWPVLVLSTYWRGDNGTVWAGALWLGFVIVSAVLSWAFVERPLRYAPIAAPRFLGGTLALAAALLAIGLFAVLSQGLPGRFSPAVQAQIAASEDYLPDRSRCTTPPDSPLAGLRLCAIGPDGPPRVLVWGDDQARTLLDGLALAAQETRTPGLIVYQDGCPPLFGLIAANPTTDDAACITATETLRRGLPGLDSVERILLAGRWAYYAEGTGTGTDAQTRIALRPTPDSAYTAEAQPDLYAQALRATVAELARDIGPVFVLRQVPEIPGYSARDVARALAHGRLDETGIGALAAVAPEVLAARVVDAERPQFELATSGDITLIDPWPLLCADRCTVMQDGRPLYYDNAHLTNDGARTLRDLFVPFLTGTQSADD